MITRETVEAIMVKVERNAHVTAANVHEYANKRACIFSALNFQEFSIARGKAKDMTKLILKGINDLIYFLEEISKQPKEDIIVYKTKASKLHSEYLMYKAQDMMSNSNLYE